MAGTKYTLIVINQSRGPNSDIIASDAVHVTDSASTGETIRTCITQEAVAVDITGATHIVWCRTAGSSAEQAVGNDYEVYYVALGVKPRQINILQLIVPYLIAIIVIVGTVAVVYLKAFRSTPFSS